MTLAPAYTYSATVVHWADGDTVDLMVDVGFHITIKGRFRLYGVDTPERGQAGHDTAWNYAAAQAPVGSQVVVRTYAAAEKYGRFLADIYPAGVTKSVNDALLAAQLGKPYFGGTKG